MNKVYNKGEVEVLVGKYSHNDYITLYNIKPLYDDKVVIPVEKINDLIKELISIKIELEKYE